MENVAITGMGVISSLGLDTDSFYRGLCAARVAVAPAPWAGEEGIEYAWRSPVEDFRPEDWMEEKVVAGTDPFAQYAVAAAVQALDAAGLGDPHPLRTAVVIGTAMAGTVDVAIAGGCDAARCKVTSVAAALYGMFAQQPDPHKACLPFDVNRTGIMGGEGAGIVVLERADRARARGAAIYGYVRGYGSLSDAYHPSSPQPDGEWEIRTMEMAISEAGLPGGAAGLDAVIARGTGTAVGDIAEMRTINRLFGQRENPLPVTSIKGHVGHTAGAAGVMNLIAGLHGMKAQALVPTAGTSEVEPEVEFQVVNHEPLPVKLRTLQVNAFGFGGQDASLVVTAE